MAVRIIRKEEDEILRKISKPVEQLTPAIVTLVDDMFETLKESNGVGLAAVQVGVLKRIFIVDIGDNTMEFINPEIIQTEGEGIAVEGCLSVPDVWGEVKRPSKITIKAQNKKGEYFTVEADELFARVICHEYDHLDGNLFIDKVIKFVELEGKKGRKK